MRNWRSAAASRKGSVTSTFRTSAEKSNSCPELLIRPVGSSSGSLRSPSPLPNQQFPSLPNRNSAIMRRYSSGDPPSEEDLQPISIPTNDIVVVDVHGGKAASSEPIYVTTFSHGYFEFCFSTCTSHDVLLAFFTGSLPPERITVAHKLDRIDSDDMQANCSFDVDALTALRMRERIRTEPWSEKMRRRVLRIAGRLEELSGSMADCACTCTSGNERQGHQTPRRMEYERRQSPPRDSVSGHAGVVKDNRQGGEGQGYGHKHHGGAIQPTLSMEMSELSGIRS